MNPSRWALTLPPLPTGVRGILIALLSDYIVMPAFRYAMEKFDTWARDQQAVSDEPDDTPAQNEEAVIRMVPERVRPSIERVRS